jgi:hypothetical protein
MAQGAMKNNIVANEAFVPNQAGIDYLSVFRNR